MDDSKYKVEIGGWTEIAKEYGCYLNIPDENGFELESHDRNTRDYSDDDEFEFVEKNDCCEVVARYKVWHRMSLYSHYKADHGFKKYSPEGDLIEEGALK